MLLWHVRSFNRIVVKMFDFHTQNYCCGPVWALFSYGRFISLASAQPRWHRAWSSALSVFCGYHFWFLQLRRCEGSCISSAHAVYECLA